jgi:hypothetical protein
MGSKYRCLPIYAWAPFSFSTTSPIVAPPFDRHQHDILIRVPGDPEQGLLLEPALLNQLDRAASSSTSLRIAKMRFSYSLVSASI